MLPNWRIASLARPGTAEGAQHKAPSRSLARSPPPPSPRWTPPRSRSLPPPSPLHLLSTTINNSPTQASFSCAPVVLFYSAGAASQLFSLQAAAARGVGRRERARARPSGGGERPQCQEVRSVRAALREQGDDRHRRGKAVGGQWTREGPTCSSGTSRRRPWRRANGAAGKEGRTKKTRSPFRRTAAMCRRAAGCECSLPLKLEMLDANAAAKSELERPRPRSEKTLARCSFIAVPPRPSSEPSSRSPASIWTTTAVKGVKRKGHSHSGRTVRTDMQKRRQQADARRWIGGSETWAGERGTW